MRSAFIGLTLVVVADDGVLVEIEKVGHVAILVEKDRFTKGFAGHLLAFALARELEAADTVAVEQIAAAVAADDYRIQTVIKQVVLSSPFLNKRNPRQASDANVSQ